METNVSHQPVATQQRMAAGRQAVYGKSRTTMLSPHAPTQGYEIRSAGSAQHRHESSFFHIKTADTARIAQPDFASSQARRHELCVRFRVRQEATDERSAYRI
jgi:hypothetical protein